MKRINRKAEFNYQILEKFEAGIVLTGEEVKAVKAGGVDLTNSFARVKEGEVFVHNLNISTEKGDSTRARKLLLKKREITSIDSKIKAKNLTLVPTKMYTTRSLIKLELALSKPKRLFQKKEKKKKSDIEREVERELKEKIKF